MSKMTKKRSDRIHFNITRWKLPGHPIAYVCVDPTRCTGDSLRPCCISKVTPPRLHTLSETLGVISLFLERTVLVFTGTVSSRPQMYYLYCGLSLLSHIATDKICRYTDPFFIKESSLSVEVLSRKLYENSINILVIDGRP